MQANKNTERSRRGIAIVSGLASLLISAQCLSAEFDVSEFGTISLFGEIKSGDAERAVDAILSIKPISKNNYILPSRLVVNSKGGDILESLKIASIARSAHLDVVVQPEKNGLCASSCFFIYIAGQGRSASGIDYIQENGRSRSLGPLGVHRPYYNSIQGGPDFAKKQEDLMKAIAEMLHQEQVPQTLIDKMMSHASNDIYWLDSQEIYTLGSYRAGIEEELIRKCNYNSKNERQMSAREYIKDVQHGTQACIRDYLNKTYSPIRNDVFNKMRGGWRPW
jgi:hypothetical protein